MWKIYKVGLSEAKPGPQKKTRLPFLLFYLIPHLSKHKTALRQQTHPGADKYQQFKANYRASEKEGQTPEGRAFGAAFTSPCLRRVLLRALPARPSL